MEQSKPFFLHNHKVQHDTEAQRATIGKGLVRVWLPSTVAISRFIHVSFGQFFFCNQKFRAIATFATNRHTT
jgi:hypothetical protein